MVSGTTVRLVTGQRKVTKAANTFLMSVAEDAHLLAYYLLAGLV